MWYTDAEEYITWGGLVASGFLIWALVMKVETTRTLSLMAIAFFIGLGLGIEKSAHGSFYLPLYVMRKQMHEQWGIPMENLLRDVDK
ncbi:MAG: hypothetical protein WBX25_16720 [Rhodomicrobium sp.]